MREPTVYDIQNYIPMSECKHGMLYRIKSRNLTLGVYREDKQGFVGIRVKFGIEFLFVEYHWDTGEPFGTVKPIEILELCPIKNLDEYIETKNGESEVNSNLFEWIKQKGGMPTENMIGRKPFYTISMMQKHQKKQTDN